MNATSTLYNIQCLYFILFFAVAKCKKNIIILSYFIYQYLFLYIFISTADILYFHGDEFTF